MKRKYGDGEWCVGGDFNFVVSNKERKFSLLVNMPYEMSLFSEFIEEVNLLDLPYKGNYFSWYNGNGKSMGRLDHLFTIWCFDRQMGHCRSIDRQKGDF